MQRLVLLREDTEKKRNAFWTRMDADQIGLNR